MNAGLLKMRFALIRQSQHIMPFHDIRRKFNGDAEMFECAIPVFSAEENISGVEISQVMPRVHVNAILVILDGSFKQAKVLKQISFPVVGFVVVFIDSDRLAIPLQSCAVTLLGIELSKLYHGIDMFVIDQVGSLKCADSFCRVTAFFRYQTDQEESIRFGRIQFDRFFKRLLTFVKGADYIMEPAKIQMRRGILWEFLCG